MFLKNPLNTNGIPFIAYKYTTWPLILHLILEVGTSEGNSFTSGTIVVCNLAPDTPDDCVPNSNLPLSTIPTLAPYEIFANFWILKSGLFALGSAELHALTLDVDMSAIL